LWTNSTFVAVGTNSPSPVGSISSWLAPSVSVASMSTGSPTAVSVGVTSQFISGGPASVTVISEHVTLSVPPSPSTVTRGATVPGSSNSTAIDRSSESVASAASSPSRKNCARSPSPPEASMVTASPTATSVAETEHAAATRSAGAVVVGSGVAVAVGVAVSSGVAVPSGVRVAVPPGVPASVGPSVVSDEPSSPELPHPASASEPPATSEARNVRLRCRPVVGSLSVGVVTLEHAPTHTGW
jgi:hypothetical protein